MTSHRLRTAVAGVIFMAAAYGLVARPFAQAPSPAAKYPPAKKGTVVENYFGT
jgi:hypothetical protein